MLAGMWTGVGQLLPRRAGAAGQRDLRKGAKSPWWCDLRGQFVFTLTDGMVVARETSGGQSSWSGKRHRPTACAGSAASSPDRRPLNRSPTRSGGSAKSSNSGAPTRTGRSIGPSTPSGCTSSTSSTERTGTDGLRAASSTNRAARARSPPWRTCGCASARDTTRTRPSAATPTGSDASSPTSANGSRHRTRSSTRTASATI